MLKNVKTSSRKNLKIIIYSAYLLAADSIEIILKSKPGIEVSSITSTKQKLLEIVSNEVPDLVLFCLLENDNSSFEIMNEIKRISPDSKGLVLSPMTGTFDHTKALKTGVTGIVGANERAEVLIRAIRQVGDGEVWINQKLFAKLVGDYANGDSKSNGNGKNSLLTSREYDVIEAISKGLNNKDISKRLFISEATVRHHLSSIYSKLYIEDRLNLVIYAFQHNLLDISSEN